LRARRWYLNELRPVFERFDLLVHPAMPVIPPRIGEETVSLQGEEIPYRLSLIPFNSPWSLAGAPVASVPCGFVEGMPAGLALVGRPSGEATTLRAAATFQRVTDWHRRRPQPILGTGSR
jgi:aspartyl-tRNA(Asn)/glutamyl-tRNA(Gln) amidotransferase subunit A